MPSDIDTLIAALHPHVAQGYCGNFLRAGRSLRPIGANGILHDVVDSFDILFGFHPGCDAAAVTIQTAQPGTISLFVCPSPIVPQDFEADVKQWVDQFIAVHKGSAGEADGNGNLEGKPSPSMRKFILDTYRLCYQSMRQRKMGPEFGIWKILSRKIAECTLASKSEPAKLQELPSASASELRQLAELAKSFAETISARERLDEDEDILRFHQLCLALYKALSGGWVKELTAYPLRDLILAHLCLPRALSTLLSEPSAQPEVLLALHHSQWSITVLDPTRGARRFSSTVTAAHMAERFGKVDVRSIDWEEAMEAYRGVVVRSGDFGNGLEWDAARSLLTSPGAVTAHPETTLIQHLVKNGDVNLKGDEQYVACSRLPCYASVRYVDAVNKAVKGGPTFTVRTTNPDWCRLDVAEPWILPEGTDEAVVAGLREAMLWDLDGLLYRWRNDAFRKREDESDDNDDGDGGDHDDNEVDDEEDEDEDEKSDNENGEMDDDTEEPDD